MSNGFTWNRYWVRFTDGQVVGHINHGDLVRAKHYEQFLAAREREASAAEQASAAAAVTADSEAQSAPANGSGDVVVNGVTIPAYLLQRSADARARLGA